MSEPDVSSTSLENLVKRVAKIVDGEQSISNKVLIELCKEQGGFNSAVDSHFCHEIAETAFNSLIREKYGRHLLASTDPIDAVSTILRPLQNRLPTQTWRSETQIAYQQFSTPATIAHLAAYLLNIQSNETVLEPSCGTGSLAVWARAAGAKVITNEIDPRRRTLAHALGLTPFTVDAEFVDDLLPHDLIPDIVLVNPPFSSTGGRVHRNRCEFGFRHVESALRRLRPSGRFAAILGENGSLTSATGSRFWNSLCHEIRVRMSIELPGREFYCNGTSVKTTVIIGTKHVSSRGTTSDEVGHATHIVAKSVEDAFEQALVLNIRF